MSIEKLPLKQDIESKAVLKQAAQAHRYLGELQGIMNTVPNKFILLSLLPLQEAKYSSEIENIITTQDDIFKSKVDNNLTGNIKEVRNYEKALIKGFELVRDKKMLTNNMIKTIQQIIKENDAGFRTQAGTNLKNNFGELIYTPPQEKERIFDLMDNLEKFINDNDFSDLDPLVKMAIIHHQFESIHPFYDGNGRVGRIINILYLCLQKLLDLPVLFLSRYIIDRKSDYYRLLQEVRDEHNWEEWILFMLNGIVFSACESIVFIEKIIQLTQEFKHQIRAKYPKIYSQDLINSLFKYPYTKIGFIVKDLKVSRTTATKYLNIVAENGFLEKVSIGRSNYYINQKLIKTAIEHRKITLDIMNQRKKHV